MAQSRRFRTFLESSQILTFHTTVLYHRNIGRNDDKNPSSLPYIIRRKLISSVISPVTVDSERFISVGSWAVVASKGK